MHVAHVKTDRPLSESLHEWLLGSAHRTADPEEADYFFIPVAIRMAGGERSQEALEYIARTWPFFNRSLGADHLLAVTDDSGLASVVRSAAVAFPQARGEKMRRSRPRCVVTISLSVPAGARDSRAAGGWFGIVRTDGRAARISAGGSE